MIETGYRDENLEPVQRIVSNYYAVFIAHKHGI